jgi:hypothetical protein
VEEAFAQDADKDKEGGPKKMKRQFYYYALSFEVDFQYDKDTVYFAFSQPYPYTQMVKDVLDVENQIRLNDSCDQE